MLNRNVLMLFFVMIISSCGRGTGSDKQLQGSTATDVWSTATPQLKYRFCVRDKIASLAEASETANEPGDLEAAYLPFGRSIDSCASLVSSETQPTLAIGEAVKTKVRETIGEISADYLSEMELVQTGNRGRTEALKSWRMWAMVGIHEADELIPD